MKSRFFLQEM